MYVWSCMSVYDATWKNLTTGGNDFIANLFGIILNDLKYMHETLI